jgi:cytochrome c oxidase cbb3-type subunit 4
MLSGIVTSILLLLFLAGWAWAWSPRRKADFDAAARLALDDAGPDAGAREDRP